VIITHLFPNSMRSDRPEFRDATIELTDADIRKALKVPPPEHAQANDAQVELLLAESTHDELKSMVRELRRMLAGAEFAARLNAETMEAVRRGR
jgi:hypothetical protein